VLAVELVVEHQNNEKRSPVLNSVRGFVSSWLSNHSDVDFPGILDDIHVVQLAALEVLATDLAPRINAYVAGEPQATVEEKRILAKRVNAELRSLGLGIECPSTGLVAHISVDHGKNAKNGRFRFLVLDEAGHMSCHSTAAVLPELKLTVIPPARDGRACWTQRIRAESKSSGPDV
jgi:hypothetical protein